MTNIDKLTGIILAGGKSARFGTPKYLALIDSRNLLDIAVEKLLPFCNEIIIVSKTEIATPLPACLPAYGMAGQARRNDETGRRGLSRGDRPPTNRTGTVPALKSGCPHVLVKYIIEKDNRFHPLIGIAEGLKASSNTSNIVIACDTPFISRELIANLIPSPSRGRLGGGADVRLYRHKGRLEPLFGYYSKSCLPKISNFLNSRLLTPDSRLKSRIIDFIKECSHEIIELNENSIDFFNINTKEDLDEANRLVKSNPKLIG